MTEQKLGTIGWGLSFLWIGLALFMGYQFNIILIGIAIIILIIQLIRKVLKFQIELFWLIIGICLLIFNLVKLPQINIPIIPILLIIFGVLFFGKGNWEQIEKQIK